ncbi:hypothetical protein [Nitratireductor sp. OM-1]|uniref:protein-tyrosine phosphatase family protein n=1 Tax=Nitratireductor sp. OM-1 TaxID=1756988 RepID=UPI00352E07DB
MIYGGSCLNPAVTDADIYIGFDSGMSFTPRQFPWTEGHELLFKIQDMGTPNNVDQFRQLIDWTYQQLQEGKKVHCGCIGGHGRTGTFLAALVSLCGEKDAVSYVRENYCHKAVESRPQIEFLSKHFGIKPAKGSKSTGGSAYGSKVSTALKERTFPPIRNNGCIWDEL